MSISTGCPKPPRLSETERRGVDPHHHVGYVNPGPIRPSSTRPKGGTELGGVSRLVVVRGRELPKGRRRTRDSSARRTDVPRVRRSLSHPSPSTLDTRVSVARPGTVGGPESVVGGRSDIDCPGLVSTYGFRRLGDPPSTVDPTVFTLILESPT